MVALKTERRVYMWHVMPRPAPKEAPVNVNLAEIIGILKAGYDADQAEIYLSEDGRVLGEDAPDSQKDRKNRVYIADLAEDGHTVTLLINRGDPFAAEPAFIDAESDAVRTISPGKNESQGWSAHMVISKKAMAGKHRACFERMPHTSSWYAEMLIRTLLERHARRDSKYVFTKTVRKGRKTATETKPYRPHMSVRKVPSEQIKEDLKRGELSHITLIDSNYEYRGPDAPGVVRSVKNSLVIRPEPVDKTKIMKFLDKLAPWAKSEGYTEIQIKIVNLPGNASASPRFLLEKEDATETLYVRTQRLTGFGEMLENCYARINAEIKAQMIGLLSDNGKW